MSATWCSGRCSVATTTSSTFKGAVAQPTRHFDGTYKFLKCDMHGKVFENSSAAFDAMHAHGYGERYYPRMSVVLPTFAGLEGQQRQARFDALYRYYKWCVRHSECLFPMSRQGTPLQVQRAKLQAMAKKVGIFHPVARAFNSPHETGYDFKLKRPCGRMERSELA